MFTSVAAAQASGGGVVTADSSAAIDAAKPQPIDLPTTLRLAGARNLDVQLARARLAEAKAAHESAVAQFFPWISPGVSYRQHDHLLQDVFGNIADVTKQSYTAGAALDVQMNLGDAIYQTLAARQLVKAADEGLAAQRQDTLLAAAQGYFELAKAQGEIGVAREALAVSEDYQRQVREAITAGLTFKGDEYRVTAQTERYRLTARQAEERARVAAARLAQTLRLNPAVLLVAREDDLAPLTLVAPDAALDALVRQALASRPELRQSQAVAAASRQTENGVVYGPLIPTIGGQAFGGGLGGGKNGAWGTLGETEDFAAFVGWRVGPGGLFDSGRIHAARSRSEIARLNEEKRKDEIVREVVEARTRAQSFAEQVETAKRALGAATETVRLTRERKAFAVGIVLENIQALQDLARAREDYLTAVAAACQAQFALSRAIGGPLAAPDPAPAP